MSLTIEVKFYDVPDPQTYTIPWSASMNIQDAMEKCFNQYSAPHAKHPFTFWIQYYGTYNSQFLGYMPIEINGRRRSGPYIWYVYLNGDKTNNSLDATTLEAGDVIEFKFETYSAAQENDDSIYKAMANIHEDRSIA